jgi:hypothetical protein
VITPNVPVGLKIANISLDRTQYNTLNQLTQLIAAPGAGLAIIPVQIFVQRAFNGVGYSGTNSLRVRHALAGTSMTNLLTCANVTGSSDIQARYGIDWSNTVPTNPLANQPLYAIPDATVTGGSALDRMHLNIWYFLLATAQ